MTTNLRQLVESDLYETMEREWKIPIELTAPDGNKQIYSVNNPSERLGGQVLYYSRRESPTTGEPIVVNEPVVSIRISSLIRVPVAGEKWIIKMPISPRDGAAWHTFLVTSDRSPESGTDIGFVRLYPQRIVQDGSEDISS